MKISQIPEGAEMHVCGVVFDPKFSQVLIVNNKAYKGKRAGTGVPGGRTSTSALLELLQYMLGKKPGNWLEMQTKMGKPEDWTTKLNRLFKHNDYENVLNEIFKELQKLKREEKICWDDLEYGIKEMLLREKLCIEIRDETGVEKEELEILNLVSCDIVTYPDKIIYRIIYFCATEAAGIPRKHYKDEIDESRWFDVNFLPASMYQKHKEIFRKTEIGHLAEYWRKRERRKKRYERAASIGEPDYQKLFEGMGREE